MKKQRNGQNNENNYIFVVWFANGVYFFSEVAFKYLAKRKETIFLDVHFALREIVALNNAHGPS